MRKMILCLGVALIGISTFNSKNVEAFDTKTTVAASAPADKESDNENTSNSGSRAVYNQIDFDGNKMSFEAFDKAYQGYMNLKKAGKLSGRDIITIADFSLVSTSKRLWVIDLSERKVLYNTHVAHGQGSGNAYATAFSNTNSSHQSSIGFYVTGGTYYGKHGNSLRLSGMDRGYNDNAEDRAVVMHSAHYCSESYIDQNNRLGRSWGCPAVSPEMAQPIINTIKGGTALFIYAPQAKYSSVWLNG